MERGEFTNQVNENITLIQRDTGLTFGTDALLLAAYIHGAEDAKGIELGGGSGIISLLLGARNKVKQIECVEIQKTYADLIRKNVDNNGMGDKISVTHADIRDHSAFGTEGDYDIVFTNPPYMKNDTPPSPHAEKQIARHEVHGTVLDFVLAAKKKLRWGGRFFVVYRPDRLVDLLSAMREGGIEPKRMTYVHSDPQNAPSMVLVEGKRGGKGGLVVTPPLFVGNNTKERAESPDMVYILENGRFPKRYE